MIERKSNVDFLPQAQIVEPCKTNVNGSLEVPDQAAVRDAVQQKLEGSAAKPATRRRQSKRNLQAGDSSDQTTDVVLKKRQPAAALQGVLGIEHDSRVASPAAPVTPENKHRTRQGRTRQRLSS